MIMIDAHYKAKPCPAMIEHSSIKNMNIISYTHVWMLSYAFCPALVLHRHLCNLWVVFIGVRDLASTCLDAVPIVQCYLERWRAAGHFFHGE